MIIVYEKSYSGDLLLNDVAYDIIEAFDPTCNPTIKILPKDKYGNFKGKFTFHITYQIEEEVNLKQEVKRLK